MVFSEPLFLMVFLPLCLLTYYAAKLLGKRKILNGILLIFSIIFYAFGGIKYLILMLFVIGINYSFGFFVKKSKVYLALAVITNISILFFFKYWNLFVAIIENIFFRNGEMFSFEKLISGEGTGYLGFKEIILPIGISFYIFQALSYVLDVYNEKTKVQKNIFLFALYVSFFPQLIAGPIVQYKDIEKQMSERVETPEIFGAGIKRFCYGLGKKVLIANVIGEFVDKVWALDLSKIGSGIAFLAAVGYSLQIYYDFSGYSDMAIGIGKMFGFTFKENFNIPYSAISVRDFWRRWHISLGAFFREYVYIPLGGSKKGKGKLYRNIFIVFLLTGIWHGANFTFLIWGLLYAVLLIIERMGVGKFLEKSPLKMLNRIFVFTIVTLLWIVFRADCVSDAIMFLKSLIGQGSNEYDILSLLSLKTVLAGLVGLFTCGLKRKKENGIVAIVLLLLSLLFIYNSTYNPFIYFQF